MSFGFLSDLHFTTMWLQTQCIFVSLWGILWQFWTDIPNSDAISQQIFSVTSNNFITYSRISSFVSVNGCPLWTSTLTQTSVSYTHLFLKEYGSKITLDNKTLLVNYPFPSTDLHQKQKIASTLQIRAVCKKLFDSVWICGCYCLP